MDQDQYENQKAGYYDGNEEEFEVCENLVDNSLQCNAKLDKKRRYSQKNVGVCNYIDSFQKGNIDSTGKLVTKMTVMDWLVLLFIIPGCISMVLVIAFYAYTSRNSIDNDDLDDNLVGDDNLEPGVRFSDDEPAVFT